MFNLLSPFKLYAALGAVILVAAILGIHLYHDRGVRNERDTAVSNLASYKVQQKTLSDAAILDNARKLAQALVTATNLKTERDMVRAQLNLANTTTEQLKKGLQDDKTIINRAIARADQLRIKPAASNTAGMPQVSIPTELSTESGNECNTALARVTRAAQDTTINYNSLYESWAKSCAIYGCE